MSGDLSYKEIGRLRYFEPSRVSNENNYGLPDDFIAYPYEDYSMAIDLSIEVHNRYSCGFGKEDGQINTYNYSSENGTVSFLGGSKYGNTDDKQKSNYLTVNYTDISMQNPEKNTSECLGIESINITYDSWFYPQVTIKFVDIRGGTVFQPNEKDYYNSGDGGNSKSIYKSFFSFPYPLFTLRVKGFYGKGVTYKLAVNKTTMDFDSNTGNFNITVNFIGYMYGIFADIPMTLLAIAPYTEKGSQYWNKQKSEGAFKFGSKTGEGCEMLTFPELRLKIAQVSGNQEIIDNDKAFDTEIGKLNEQISNLEKISNTNYPFKESDGWIFFSDNKNAYKVVYSSDDFAIIGGSIKSYVEYVSGYDYTYGTSYSQKLESLKKYNIEKPQDEISRTKFTDKSHYSSNSGGGYCYTTYISGFTGELFKNLKDTKKQFYVVVIPNDTSYSFKDVLKDMEKEMSELTSKKNERKKEQDKIRNSLIEQALGFKPSIKNIYDLAFAHMDTFMFVFYEYMKEIKAQLDVNGDRTKRKKEHYNIANGDTDTENAITLSTTQDSTNRSLERDRGNYLPPFPAFYKYDKNTDDGASKKILRWPDDGDGGIINSIDLVEVGFVKDLLTSANLYFEKAYDVEEVIRNMSKQGNLNIGDLSTNVKNFIPITTYDFLHHNGTWNPYNYLKSKVKSDTEYIEGDVIFSFVLRAFYFFSTNTDNSFNASTFGTIEALNFFKAVGDNVSDNFMTFINGFANQDVSYFTLNNILPCLTGSCGSVISGGSNKVSDSWNGIGTNKLFKLVDNYYYYDLYQNNSDNFSFLPIGSVDSSVVKKDFAKGNSIIEDESYLLIDKIENYNNINGDFCVDRTMNKGTFTVIEDGNYIITIKESIKSEIEESENKLKEKTGDEGFYYGRSGDEYGRISNGNVVDSFSNAFNGKDDDAVYRRWCIVDGSGSKERQGKLKDIVRGSEEEQSKYYIKYPSSVNEAIGPSVFGDDLYKQQSDIYCKAYLFLQSLPILSGKGGRQRGTGFDEKSENGVSMKSILLREGAFYWYDEYGYDLIKTSGYKKAGKGYWYNCDKYTLWNVIIGNNERNFYTYSPLKTNEDGDYVRWLAPKNSSKSRRIYLMRYFMKWAKDSFIPYEKSLLNKELYDGKNVNSGLNISIITSEEYNVNKDEAIKLQGFLRDLFFKECTVFDYYNGSDLNYLYPYSGATESSEGILSCNKDNIVNSLTGFLRTLRDIYGKTVEEYKESPSKVYENIAEQERTDPFKNDDLRLSTYMTLKSLYDKWLCAPPNGIETWKLNCDGSGKTISDFDNFVYIDNYYRDISYDLVVNVTKVSEWISKCLPTTEAQSVEGIMGYFNKTLYEYLAEIAQDCGGMLIALPQKLGTMSGATEDMFKPIPTLGDWCDDTSTFVFVYTYKPSEKLGDTETNIDMNGWSPDGDGFDLTNEEIVGELMGGSGYTIQSFGVTYAKQNQSYFKNITLNSEVQGATEVGLRATFDIASKASQQPRETTLFGQDLYKVFSNYAYECTVDAMGNMQIFPLMYFQLNNIPLWKGAYMIKKVSHNITAGNISTTFTGIRQNRYAIPFADASVTIDRGESQKNGNGDVANTDVSETHVDISGISGVENNIHPNPDAKLANGTDVSDINESNISESKPLICIMPAHGPETDKKLEWAWSSKMIDNYLIPKLKMQKYSDGTQFNVHRCNVNGNNTYKNGYSTTETQSIIKKYGSKCVISVVPHWNGGHTSHFLALKNNRNENTRKDSIILCKYMIAEAYKLLEKANNGAFSTMPIGFMSEKEQNWHKEPAFPPDGTNDGAVKLDCACVLSENWFADYSVNGISYTSSNYDELDANGRYQTGRAWLESDEGCNAVADMHVSAIVNYINSLGKNSALGGGNYVQNNENYDVNAACSWIWDNSHTSSQHACAKYVRMAIEHGGVQTNGRPSWAWKYINYLPTIGFGRVASFQSNNPNGYTPVMGDIAVYKKENRTDVPGHICMFTGQRWCSDFKQNNMVVYSSPTTVDIFRFGFG